MKEKTREPGPGVSGSREDAMLDLPKIKKLCEAGIPAMVSCPSTTEDLHLTAEGYAYIGRLRTSIFQLVEELEEAQATLKALSWQEPDGTRHWCEFAARGESDIAVNDCNCDEGRAILGESE